MHYTWQNTCIHNVHTACVSIDTTCKCVVGDGDIGIDRDRDRNRDSDRYKYGYRYIRCQFCCFAEPRLIEKASKPFADYSRNEIKSLPGHSATTPSSWSDIYISSLPYRMTLKPLNKHLVSSRSSLALSLQVGAPLNSIQ